MHLIWALIVGLVVGAIAKLIMPGSDPGGIIITMLLGVAGSFVAGFLGRALGLYRAGDVGPGLIASVIGAMMLLAGLPDGRPPPRRLTPWRPRRAAARSARAPATIASDGTWTFTCTCRRGRW